MSIMKQSIWWQKAANLMEDKRQRGRVTAIKGRVRLNLLFKSMGASNLLPLIRPPTSKNIYVL